MGKGIVHKKQPRMSSVLWLTSWYPSRVHPTNGDFVERHAHAVTEFVPLVVLLIEKDENLPAGKTEITKTEEKNLTVYKVYYGKSSWGKLFEKVHSVLKYRSLQKKMYADIMRKHGVPSLVHVHVAMKAGMLALYLKSKYRIPFVLTEHWTGYYKESEPNIYTIGNTLKSLIKQVIQKASQVFPVSDDLGKRICESVTPVPFESIPNVADTRIFNFKASENSIFRFIHPSYLNYQKNPEGMIEAAALLAKKGYQFELVLLGNKKPELESLAKQKGLLNTHVIIKDFVSYPEVANQMQQSSALLMFSRFENLPCVILEALCCGLPVISTRVGGIAEIVNGDNGLLVNNEDVEGLANAMQKMIDDYSTYNRLQIAEEAAKKFSYPVVGAKYNEWYKTIIAGK